MAIRDLNVLAHTGFGQDGRLTIIRVGRPSSGPQSDLEDVWSLAITLKRLTRSQVNDYLAAKLEAAGCSERVFTPRAVTPSMACREASPGTRTDRHLESHGGGRSRTRSHTARRGRRRRAGMPGVRISGEGLAIGRTAWSRGRSRDTRRDHCRGRFSDAVRDIIKLWRRSAKSLY